MKIAIIGGGTAGFLAAAHISRFFPEHDLYQIYDPAASPIGVGEGTLPFFARWLDTITGLSFEQLAEQCDATTKHGIQFEGWGQANARFTHLFGGGSYAYHISASKLSGVLSEHIRATTISQRVTALEREGFQARLRFDGGEDLLADFVFDARGFPHSLGQEQTPFPEIPTNAALVTGGPVTGLKDLTRAVAQPHGWIFVIPLANRNSYGYIYNAAVTPEEEVQADFDSFFRQEQVTPNAGRRILRFPSFMQNTFFDGVVFKLGNRAAFLEPLEATAIGITLEQLKIASLWLSGGYLNDLAWQSDNAATIQAINETLGEQVRAVSLFVSWHYACGSVHDTKFWAHARSCFEEGRQALTDTPTGKAFERLISAGAQIPVESLPPSDTPDLTVETPGDFGGFNALSFAQIGRGIGYI